MSVSCVLPFLLLPVSHGILLLIYPVQKLGRSSVHQLYFIQLYPDLYENLSLLSHISEEQKQSLRIPRKFNDEVYREFEGKVRLFDALSFWIIAYTREHERTFAVATAEHRVRRLDALQLATYQTRLAASSKVVLERFQITVDELYKFLYELTELYEDYRKAERFKLSDELRNDIIYLGRLIALFKGIEWEDVANELGTKTFWAKRTFRHLDVFAKERDETLEVMKGVALEYSKILDEHKIPTSTHTFLEAEIDELVNYCQHEGLTILLTAASGMIATSEERASKFRPVTKYTNLKNILTASEYLLKSLTSTKVPPLSSSTVTLTAIIMDVMKSESWYGTYVKGVNASLTKAQDSTQFFINLTQILNDKNLLKTEDTYWARTFLVACLARNGIVHNYAKDDWFFGDLFGEMLRAAIYSILYSWQLANREGWV